MLTWVLLTTPPLPLWCSTACRWCWESGPGCTLTLGAHTRYTPCPRSEAGLRCWAHACLHRHNGRITSPGPVPRSIICLPEMSPHCFHRLIKYSKNLSTHLLWGKPILPLPPPKSKSTKDYLYQKRATTPLCPTVARAEHHLAENITPAPWGLSHRPEGSKTLCCKDAEQKDVFWYLITPSPSSLPHRQQSWARNEEGQFHIAHSLPTPASFSSCMTISNTGTTQDNWNAHPCTKYCRSLTQLAQDELSSVPVALGTLYLRGLGMQSLRAALLCLSGMRFGYWEHWKFVTQEEEIIKLTSSWFNTLILKLKQLKRDASFFPTTVLTVMENAIMKKGAGSCELTCLHPICFFSTYCTPRPWYT